MADKNEKLNRTGQKEKKERKEKTGQPEKGNSEGGKHLISLKGLIFAFVFGLVALGVVLAGLRIPIPGAGVVTDPRELFTTTGAALSGPIGGIIIGVLAGIAEPGGIPLASIFAHLLGALWVGFTYKKLVYPRLSKSLLLFLLSWVGIILVYYFVLVVPGFVIGMAGFYPDIFAESFAGANSFQAYWILAKGVIPEALFTIIITMLALFAILKKNRAPLW